MKVVALISGGKDSCFNMMSVFAEGHEIVALGNLYPGETGKDELDSYMYQTVGHEAISLYSEAMDIPLFKRKISGVAKCKDLNYIPSKEDEVEDLYELLQDIKMSIPFDAVASGAILSDYQRVRVESVCARLGLTSLSYLWRRNQDELLQEMIECQVKAVVIKTAALGLEPRKHLGKTLREMSSTLHTLNAKYGCHICGEGGEFETFTLDCPLFKREIVIDESEIIIHSDDFSAPVGYLKLKKLHLEHKQSENMTSIRDLPIMTSKKWLSRFMLNMHRDGRDQRITVEPRRVQWREPCSSNTHIPPTVSENGSFVVISNFQGTTKYALTSEEVQKVTWKSLSRIQEILENYNHTLQDLCYVQINVAEMSHYKDINRVYLKFFLQNPPSRACIGCIENTDSQEDKVIFQLYCISCKDKMSKGVMHVQGISHWAPANIGPFSQCVSQNGLLFVSGTIGLVSGTMQLVEGLANHQAKLALDHIQAVTLAIGSVGIESLMQCICYTTKAEDINCGIDAWQQATASLDSCCCKALYLVINELPKKALVEWQGIAYRTGDLVDVLCESGSRCSGGISSKWDSMRVSREWGSVYSLVLSLVVPDDCEELNLVGCISRILEDLQFWLVGHQCSHRNVVHASLYCAGSAHSLQDGWDQAWDDSNGMNVTPTSVRYIFYDNQYCALTLFCFIDADL